MKDRIILIFIIVAGIISNILPQQALKMQLGGLKDSIQLMIMAMELNGIIGYKASEEL